MFLLYEKVLLQIHIYKVVYVAVCTGLKCELCSKVASELVSEPLFVFRNFLNCVKYSIKQKAFLFATATATATALDTPMAGRIN